jgi:phycocyanobilin lyase alpha subunit
VLSTEPKRLEEKQSQPAINPDINNDGNLTIAKAIANLQGDDLGLRVYAAWWLGRFRVDDPIAIDLLIKALHDEDDRTSAGGYPMRRNAARALGKINHPKAVPPLIESLSCADFYVREAAAQSLEMLGDRQSIAKLSQLLANQVSGTLPAPEQKGLMQPYDAIIEALGSLGAIEAIPLIQTFLDHEVERIKFAAARAMYQLTLRGDDPTAADQYGDLLITGLQHDELQIRRTVLADIGAIGYLAAAPAIAATLAENSLKLIALKGLLETHLNNRLEKQLDQLEVLNANPNADAASIPNPDHQLMALGDQVAEVIRLMDDLL